MKLIIGLGNPGKKFINTRHNVGFMVIDQIIENLKAEIKNSNLKLKASSQFKAEILSLLLDNKEKLVLAKPQTFMNNSGLAVKKIISYFSQKDPYSSLLPADYLCVVHDDLDIKLGEYKLQFGRGAAGHHGVESIIKELASKEFWRLRIGINNRLKSLKVKKLEGEDYVLEKFSPTEKKVLDKTIKTAIQDLWSMFNDKSNDRSSFH